MVGSSNPSVHCLTLGCAKSQDCEWRATHSFSAFRLHTKSRHMPRTPSTPALLCSNIYVSRFRRFPATNHNTRRWISRCGGAGLGPADHFPSSFSGRDNVNSRDLGGQFPSAARVGDGDKAKLEPQLSHVLTGNEWGIEFRRGFFMPSFQRRLNSQLDLCDRKKSFFLLRIED